MDKSNTLLGKLFIIPTPIGNLADITIRALETLKTVDYILAEDTRHTMKLLKHYGISTSLKSYHKFNEHKIKQHIINDLINGKHVGLVSDAGTPGISDPGYLIIRECILNNISIECLPGPTALIPAIVLSGFPSDKFVFEGFLPHKKGRKKLIEQIASNTMTTVLYESPHRILKTLTDLHELIGNDKSVCLCKELTKIHETVIRGTFSELINYVKQRTIKGEIVIIIGTNFK